MEAPKDGEQTNIIDPMMLVPSKRDPFPKLTLGRTGYLADGYPLCAESINSTSCAQLSFFTGGKQAKGNGGSTRRGRPCANPLLITDGLYGWNCVIQAQVHADGQVGIIHNSAQQYHVDNPTRTKLKPEVMYNDVFQFPVLWSADEFSTVASGCGTGCVIEGTTCVCTPALTMASSYMPSRTELISSLKIGSSAPDSTYTQCISDVCLGRTNVWAYLQTNFDDTTIFKIFDHFSGDYSYYKNVQANVVIGSFSFRNPPHFVSFIEPTAESAAAETEAVIDHLFQHRNTAPFICQLLIQRLVTSNPSPRYMEAVSAAFRSGTYNGHTFSGKHERPHWTWTPLLAAHANLFYWCYTLCEASS